MSTGQNDTIDLRAIVRKILRLWWLFAIVTLISVAVAVWHVKTTPKTYEVQGVMLMSDTKRNSFGGQAEEFIKGTSYLSSSAGLEDEISIFPFTSTRGAAWVARTSVPWSLRTGRTFTR